MACQLASTRRPFADLQLTGQRTPVALQLPFATSNRHANSRCKPSMNIKQVTVHAATGYDAITEKLVGFSSVPFTVVVLPQVLQNYQNIVSGDLAAVAGISWLGYCAGLSGNALMCTHLATRKEQTAVAVQLIGIASSILVLSQLWWAGVMPTAAFAPVLVAALVSSVMGVLQAQGKVSPRVWGPFQLMISAIGVISVPQVLWSAFVPAQATVLPSLLAVAVVGTWLRGHAQQSSDALQAAVASLPGWCATCMFALSPVPQLVRNFTDLSSLQGLSVGTMILALLGNALCVPRALYSRDAAWTVGTTWGCLTMGWAQLLSMYLGTSPITGSRYVSGPFFGTVSAALLAYFTWVMTNDARAKQLSHPLASYPNLFSGKQKA